MAKRYAVQALVLTMQSSVYAGPSGVATTVPVTRGGEPSIVAPTILINGPLYQEMKVAFAKVFLAFQEMFTKHG